MSLNFEVKNEVPSTLRFVSRHGLNSDLKNHLKEKFVSILEDIFNGTSQITSAREEGFSFHQSMQRFWDELFLLKVNESYLSEKIAITPEEELTSSLKGTISLLFSTCLRYFEDENFIRVGHALEIFSIILKSLLQKRFDQQWLSVLTLLSGSTEIVEIFFSKLIFSVSALLIREDSPDFIKSLCLRLVLIILSATDKIESNSMASFIIINNIYDAIYKVIHSQLISTVDYLQFDAMAIFIQLISWKRSENMYIQKLSSLSTSELITFLQTITMMLSKKNESTVLSFSPSKLNNQFVSERMAGKAKTTNENKTKSNLSPFNDLGLSDYLFAYVSSLTGLGEMFAGGRQLSADVAVSDRPTLALGSPKTDGSKFDTWKQNIKDEFVSEKRMAEISSSLLFLYFLLHKNQTMKTSNVWSGPNSFLVSAWSNTLRSFVKVLPNVLSANSLNEPGGLVRAKICFIIYRLLLESNPSFDCLIRFDFSDTGFSSIDSNNGPAALCDSGILHIMTKEVLKFLNSSFQSASPSNYNSDPEIFEFAISGLAILFNQIRKRKLSFHTSFFGFSNFWKSLVRICKWCGEEKNFQKSKVIELANLCVDFFESFLGFASDEIVASDEVEKLHAIILGNFSVFGKLSSTAQKFASVYGPEWKLEEKFKLVNLKEVNSNYELQLISMYGTVKPSEPQILNCVKKVGFENVKLKFRHVGPTYLYSDGTTENQIINRLLDPVLFFHKKYFSLLAPKFELVSL